MTKLTIEELGIHMIHLKARIEALEGMQGVKGPERRLVEESRSDGEQDGAEERKERSDCSEEGRRVEEIVERNMLLRYLDRRIVEARAVQDDLGQYLGMDGPIRVQHGKLIALTELRRDIERWAEKRSDLLNAPILARPDGASNQQQG